MRKLFPVMLLFYRGMDIGTAKPTKEEMAKVPHHCIDMNPVNQSFDITQFDACAGQLKIFLVEESQSL